MPYKEHEIFRLPESLNAKVWRFMDFTKFMDLIISETLYFNRADKFIDVYDGAYSTYSTKEELANKYSDASFNNLVRKNSLISCWHLNEFESAAMWDLYTNRKEGIAIQTTVSKIIKAFDNTKEEIRIGMVEYIDFKKDSNYSNEGFQPILTKRKSFIHESELRLVYNSMTIDEEKSRGLFKFAKEYVYEHGVNIEVNLDLLVEKIYIHPLAPPWFENLVINILDKLGKRYLVEKSLLYDIK